MKKACALRWRAVPSISFFLQWWLSMLFGTKCSSACGERDLMISM